MRICIAPSHLIPTIHIFTASRYYYSFTLVTLAWILRRVVGVMVAAFSHHVAALLLRYSIYSNDRFLMFRSPQPFGYAHFCWVYAITSHSYS